MKIKNKWPLVILLLAPLLYESGKVSAQVQVINNGASVSVLSALMYIDGDVFHQDNGSMVNSGDIRITGNWTNNNASGNIFSNGPDGWVRLQGDTQSVAGSTATLFNNLELAGTGIKQLNNTDVQIEDTLALNDKEFFAGENTVFILNAGTGAITRANILTGGFISSINDGGLSRNTASASTYAFPVGSGAGIARYRPVDLTPDSSAANTFKVRMANVNPANENYDINLKDSSLCEINPGFYHRIYHTAGNSAAGVKIYYDAAADGNYQAIAHWGSTGWENTGNNNSAPGPPLSSLTKSGWDDFATNPFALAKAAPESGIATNAVCSGNEAVFSAPGGFAGYEFFVNGVSQGMNSSGIFSSDSLNDGDMVGVILYDTISCLSDTAFVASVINPNPVVSASGNDTITPGEEITLAANGADSYLWQPGNQNGSSVTVSPKEETTYTVLGTDASGCTDTAVVTVFVDTRCIHWLPNIFSPNNDGNNDELKVLGKGLEWINLSVFDRWGNKVFESDDIDSGWNGQYKGEMLNSGVFVYIMNGKCSGSGEEFEENGNVTLTR